MIRTICYSSYEWITACHADSERIPGYQISSEFINKTSGTWSERAVRQCEWGTSVWDNWTHWVTTVHWETWRRREYLAWRKEKKLQILWKRCGPKARFNETARPRRKAEAEWTDNRWRTHSKGQKEGLYWRSILLWRILLHSNRSGSHAPRPPWCSHHCSGIELDCANSTVKRQKWSTCDSLSPFRHITLCHIVYRTFWLKL